MSIGPTVPHAASISACHDRPRPRRVFVRASQPARFADELVQGCLVATRLYVAPGAAVQIAVQTERTSRPVEVPARVLSRRAFGKGPVGLRVRALSAEHPALELLRALEQTPPGALERRVQEHSPVRVSAGFPSLNELAGELLRLLHGQVAILPLPRGTKNAPLPGDRLDVIAGAAGQLSLLSFDALCHGVARLDDGVRCLVSLAGDEAGAALRAGLLRLDPNAVIQGRTHGYAAYLDDKSAFTAP